MTRLFAAATLAAILGGTAVASEPVTRGTAQKSAPRIKAKANPILQAMAAAGARERQTIRNVCELLLTPQPQLVRFVRNQRNLLDENRQTGVREDDFVGLVGIVPARPIHERLIEWFACPGAPIGRMIKERVNFGPLSELFEDTANPRLSREEVFRIFMTFDNGPFTRFGAVNWGPIAP